jgi:hypothetical protein
MDSKILIILAIILFILIILNHVSVVVTPYSSEKEYSPSEQFGYIQTPSNCSNVPGCCSLTQYGCCPDGNTISNVDRSNCVGSCARSEFGCCPNGVTISNKDRSNCIVPICTSTKYGCCPNGNPRNKIGSNC